MTLVHAIVAISSSSTKLLYDDCWAKNFSLSNPDKHDIYPKANMLLDQVQTHNGDAILAETPNDIT